ncbi:MAG: uracil-DNA glycosylase [Burkholderiales bacterium]|nr:uracil-DNA glycosylase [Burkholderiales bacterium]
MRWSERQLAMLREMGIRVWPVGQESVVQAQLVPADAPAMASASVRATPVNTDELRKAATAALGAAQAPGRAAPASVTETGQRQAGVAAMGWEALRDAVAACTACKLCEMRKQTVFGTGSTEAQWLIVGEAPGEQEDLAGEPFVGKSGQLLDSMLRAIGLTRGDAAPQRQVYIANTVKCRPPGNRNPAPDELAQCEPFLIRQLALLKPRIIVAMGRFAVQSLLRSDEPVGRLRGRVHRYQGVPLIVTYHPAYLLRNPEDKARAWDDLCLAVETAKLAAQAA